MALRLVEVTVSEAAGLDRESLSELLEGHAMIDCWDVPSRGERRHLRLLVDSGDTEAIIDRLSRRYAGDPRFRIVLLPVEGTLPRHEEEERPATPEPAENTRSPLRRVSREELYTDLREASEPSALFVVLVVLSTAVATVGLAKDSVAIIIGAMVIAPLLGPNMALAFGATLGDLKFMRRALRANLVGIGCALMLSVAIGATLTLDTSGVEVVSRTRVDALPDVALALAAGIAGTLAFTSGAGSSLVGVMVAVALLPPLATAGMLLGAGDWAGAGGAFLLVATNVICVNLSAVATFAALGVRPSAWWEQKGARRSSRLALLVWALLLVVLLGVVLAGGL